ncbi:Tol-Pal system beta propeller repeat protein TolB [Halomonadaceae bacterium KBTZ08]
MTLIHRSAGQALILICLLLAPLLAQAEMVVRVTEGADRRMPIAVVPFGSNHSREAPQDLDGIIRDDLTMSGDLKTLEPSRMLSLPTSGDDIHFRDWRVLGQQFVLVGEVDFDAERNRYILSYELFDVSQQERLLGSRASAAPSELRTLAHHVSNRIYERVTGIPGIFNTRLAFVTRTGSGDSVEYRLKVSDVDGRRDQVLLRSSEPILSPDWSPDGKELVYVSFESGRPAIYRQVVSSGERRRIARYTGLNSAPAWSPDGGSLLLTLSKDGSADVYRMPLDTLEPHRLTRHYSINTEPSWSPDGERFAFTSDRSGNPQVYVQSLEGGEPERLTFEGTSNAHPVFGPEGQEIYYIHRADGRYVLGAVDLETGEERVLAGSEIGEAPAMAPNGRLVLYVTSAGGRKGALEVTTVDGNTRFTLPVEHDGIRDPAWSPLAD